MGTENTSRVTMSWPDFEAIALQAGASASRDETRVLLTAVHLDPAAKLAVSTDSYSLTVLHLPMSVKFSDEQERNLSARGLRDAHKALRKQAKDLGEPKVRIDFGTNAPLKVASVTLFTNDDREWAQAIVPEVEGAYPDYQSIMRQDRGDDQPEHQFMVSANKLAAVLSGFPAGANVIFQMGGTMKPVHVWMSSVTSGNKEAAEKVVGPRLPGDCEQESLLMPVRRSGSDRPPPRWE